MSVPKTCARQCECEKKDTELVVLTGGPGAGKTAVLEMVQKVLCEHVVILPEAASIVFGGGFWRLEDADSRASAQRAIFHIQRELESVAFIQKKWSIALCDRGTLDGLAYWPHEPRTFFVETGTSLTREYGRYKAVIHLESPAQDGGYNQNNSLRIETAAQAQAIDKKIHSVWSNHPRYYQIASNANFMEKARQAIKLILLELPMCCRERVTKSSLGTDT